MLGGIVCLFVLFVQVTCLIQFLFFDLCICWFRRLLGYVFVYFVTCLVIYFCLFILSCLVVYLFVGLDCLFLSFIY